MIGYYTPLLLLQAFCLYHAYQHNVVQRWYWMIIFLPGVGCLLYLYDNFYNRSNVQTLTHGVKGVINKNYKIEQLERAVRFAGNVTNKTNLADAYVAVGRPEEAIHLYTECLQGFMAGDPDLRMKLLQAHFLKYDYAAAVEYGQELEREKEKSFLSSEARVAYAWALQHTGATSRAEAVFQDMDKAYTHYGHRLEYCKFLQEVGKSEELSEKLATLLYEFEYMKGPERKHYRRIIAQIKDLHRNQELAVKS